MGRTKKDLFVDDEAETMAKEIMRCLYPEQKVDKELKKIVKEEIPDSETVPPKLMPRRKKPVFSEETKNAMLERLKKGREIRKNNINECF